TFAGGAGGAATLVVEDFVVFSDWSDGGTASDSSHYGAGSPCRALGEGDTLTSPMVNYPTQLTFYADASSSGNGFVATNYYSLDGGASWTPLGAFTVGTNGATETQSLTSSPDLSGSTGVTFRFASAFSTWYVDDVRITGIGTGEPSYVPGYSNLAVTGTSQSVTGLAAGATYFFRVRAVSFGGTSSNSAASSVTLPEAVPAAPASIWASATNATDFTAAWSAASGATSYRLDVGTNATFAAGGGSVNLMSNAGFESGDGTDWDKFETEYAITTADPEEGGYAATCSATDTRDLMQMVDIAGDGTTEYEISYWYRITAGDGSDLRIWASWAAGGQVSGDSLQPATYDAVATNWTKKTYHVVPQSGANVLNFEVRTYGGATVYLDHFFVGTSGGGSVPSYVPGYSNRMVSGTSQSVTGLTAESTYYFRARAVNGAGTSPDSPVASATTASNAPAGTPPTVDAIALQVTSVGAEFEYAVSATATDGDPILSFACTSAVDTNTWLLDENTGDFLFIPTTNQMGTNTFSFTATDKDGTSAPVAMSVKVYSAAATNGFTRWVEDQEEDPADPDFAENADVDGDGANTYEEYLADTDPAASNSVLALSGTYFTAAQVGGDTGQIRFSFPASPARYYQLEYCADLTNQVGVVVSNLGWGVPGMVVTSDAPASWYGVIRVRLDPP
ncbi:MAG: hypothetical protein AB7V22_09715, partial [Kiritimatiellia bacterium]